MKKPSHPIESSLKWSQKAHRQGGKNDNHANPAAALAPLNVGSMFWTWQLGYKFLRLDVRRQDSDTSAWSLHLGSEGCQSNAAYAGMIDNLDRCIGLLMEEIQAQNLQENTIVIFTSDNGGIRQISCQDPLRAGKG